jgi:hypothetical protein
MSGRSIETEDQTATGVSLTSEVSSHLLLNLREDLIENRT